MTAYKYYDTGTSTWKYLLQGPQGPQGPAGVGDMLKSTYDPANKNAQLAADSEVVKLTGAQTVAGVKTFSSFPVTPSSAPTTNYQTANKKYVDDTVATVPVGDVVGPASATDNSLAMFNGTTGKLIKDGVLQTQTGNTFGDGGEVIIMPASTTRNVIIAPGSGTTTKAVYVIGNLWVFNGIFNGRIKPIVDTNTSGSTITPGAGPYIMCTVTALATNTTIAAPSDGTPYDGQKLVIRIKDNGTARTLTWDAIYRNMGTVLPTTTVVSKTMYLGFIYNATDTKWDLLSYNQEV